MPGEVSEIEMETRQENGKVGDKDLNKDHSGNVAEDNAKETEDSTKGDDDDKVDLSCGIGKLRTNFFGTKFANLYTFAICFGLANLFASMVGQVIQVQLTSLERQFNIDNAKAGLFETSSRIGYISTILFAGHFAKKYHIPMIVGTAGVIQGFVLTIPAIMQFVDPYELPILPPDRNGNYSNNTDNGESERYMCDTLGANKTTEEITGDVKQVQFMVVLVVQATKGLTDTFHNGFLPILYMDDNMLDKSKMGIILGIWQVLTELSGPIGKQINGMLSEVPIDLKASEMDSSDRRFVAAWWLALLVFGLGTAFFSFPIMLFPRHLVSVRQRKAALRKAIVTFAGGEIADEVAEEEQDEAPKNQPAILIEDDNNNNTSESTRRRYSLKDSGKTSARRDSGVVYHTSRRRSSLFPPVIGPTERKVSITGDLVFDQPIKRRDSNKEESLKELLKDFPKALLRMLRQPVILLSLIDIAIVSIPYSGTSIFRNTYMANEYNVQMTEVAFVTAITTAVGTISGTVISSWVSSRVTTKLGLSLIISCTWIVTIILTPFFFIVGCDNQVVYGAEGEYGQKLNISDCDCSLSHQLISCGDDNNNYISPCYAGCTETDGKRFTECSLINITNGNTVIPGLCPTDCHTNFIIYATLQGVMMFFFAMSMIPRRLLILRIVEPQDRAFATSLFNFSFVLIGIPSPNLFGGIIDGTCLIWDDNLCTLYDRDKIRYLMSGIDMSVHTCVQITYLLTVFIFKWESVKVKRAEKKAAAAKAKAAAGVDLNVTTIQ